MPQAATCVSRMRRFTALSSTIRTGTPPAGSGRRDLGRQLRGVERHREMERAARARRALQPDASAHQLDQRRRDREPEAGAAEPARRRPSAWLNASKTVACLLRRDADAGVGDAEVQPGAARRSRASSRTATITCPRSVNLMALPTRFVRICLSRTGIADDARGHVGRDVDEDLEPLLCGADGQRLQRVADRIGQRERDRLELQLARLDLREVEDVVEDRQQRFGRALDGLEAVGLLRRELGVERQRGHADDAVHRRADLVAHVREELATWRLLAACAASLSDASVSS